MPQSLKDPAPVSDFYPTHTIILDDGNKIPVALTPDHSDGSSDAPGAPAYTEAEWCSCSLAEYERDDDGNWLFQGRPFNGRIEKI